MLQLATRSTLNPVTMLERIAGCLANSAADKISLHFDGLPPTPNSKFKKHWSENAAETKDWRELAYITGIQAKARVIGSMALLHFHVSYGDNRRHDLDGALASFKATIDGLVDAEVLEDDSMDYMIPIITADRETPRRFTINIYSLD